MVPSILVTGGTGTLGRLVVDRLRDAGHGVRVLSRRDRESADGLEYVTGDLATGEGVDAAVSGIEAVVHCAGEQKGDDIKAKTLVAAASGGDIKHLVFVSVVGADRVPIESKADKAMFGYYGFKLAAERVIEDSGIPYTILRATQFHELLFTMASQMGRMPVVPAPSGVRFQPIAADEVAARMTELTLNAPAGRVEDMGGPRTYEFKQIVRQYLRARRRHRPILPVRMPGKAARAMREGANLAPEHPVGRLTWEQFLEVEIGS